MTAFDPINRALERAKRRNQGSFRAGLSHGKFRCFLWLWIWNEILDFRAKSQAG
jgi:hypothetical protein